MTAEPVDVEQPPHPTHALTTYELVRYQRELEHALKTLPENVEVRALLQQRLTAVTHEHQARTQLQQANRISTTSP